MDCKNRLRVGDIGQLELGPHSLEGENVGYGISMIPNLSIVPQSALLVSNEGSTIPIDCDDIIRNMDSFQQPLVAENIDSRLIIQEDQVSQIELGGCTAKTKFRATMGFTGLKTVQCCRRVGLNNRGGRRGWYHVISLNLCGPA